MNEEAEPPLRVLVVDDSAYNRQTITSMIESRPGAKVVGRAVNGKEALKLVFDLEPDVITLDLEMPEMDGFSFLRLLMSKRPTPVLVISGYAQRDNVFRALELGALDFIAKPGRHISPDIREIADDLNRKISMVRRLQSVRLRAYAEKLAQHNVSVRADAEQAASVAEEASLPDRAPEVVIGVASSTGGPPAVQTLISSLDPAAPLSVLIAQHMPARFTKAFASRLDRVVPMKVVEAEDNMPLAAGVVYIAPGDTNMEVQLDGPDGRPVVRVVEPPAVQPGVPSITPSADHLFRALGETFGARFCGVVLTGMGSDGTRGAREARDNGALILAEDPETAVMPGMPHSAVEAGVVEEVAPVDRLGALIARFLQSRTSG